MVFLFGNNNIGANTYSFFGFGDRGEADCCKYTLAAPASVESILAYLRDWDTAGILNAIQFAIYSDNAGVPNALLASTPMTGALPAAFAWVEVHFVAPVVLAAGNYWLAYYISDRIDIKYDNGAVGQAKTDWIVGALPDPYVVVDSLDLALSIYADGAFTGAMLRKQVGVGL